MKSKTKIQFANAAAPGVMIGFCNEIAIGEDGWAMIAPFGDHPSTALIPDAGGRLKKQKAIQRIDKAGADSMVAGFHNSRKGIRKFLRGCNIYVGHPDVPGLEKFYPDKEPKGVFADMETRADGLYGLPVFTNEGSDIVETKKLRAFSGNLGESEADGELNGLPVYRPTKIFSAGLTNSPHLPVHFFNADGTLAEEAVNPQPQQNKMKKKLLALLAALSLKPQFANAAEPTDAESETALDLINEKVVAFANEQAAHKTAAKTLREKLLGLCQKVGITFANEAEITDPAATLAQVDEKIVTLNTDLTTARTSFANERTSRIADELAQAITTGRITAAEKPVWEGRLKVEAQFANELVAIRALKPVVKTESVIKVNRGGREQQIDISNAAARTQFVNEAMTEVAAELKLDPKKDHQKIYNEVQRRHPAVFANMAQPEIKVRGQKKG